MKFGCAAAAAVPNFAPEPAAPFFSDNWDGANASNWDYTKWPGQRGGVLSVSSNKGTVSTGSRPIALTARSVVDFDMTVQVQYSTLSGQFLEFGYRINSWMETGTPSEGYAVQINQGSTVQLFKINAYTQVGATVSTPELTGGGTFWFRIRAVGSNHKVKWWADGASEPGTWAMDYTDSTYVEGALMLGNYGSGVIAFDNLTVEQVSVEDPAVGSLRVLPQNSGGGGAVLATPGFSGPNLTFAAWFRTEGVVASGDPIIGIDDAGSNYFALGVHSTGFLQLILPSGQINTSYTIVPYEWYFGAITRTAAGCELYYAHQADASLTKQTSAGVPNITVGNLRMLHNGFTIGAHASIAAAKVWQAQLSQVELTAEMADYDPVRTSNLFANWSFKNGMSLTDESGNGKTLAWIGGSVSGPVAPAA